MLILERARNEGFDEECANDCVRSLLEYKPKENAGDLSDDDFLRYAEEMKKKKT
jgi:hypothetical protein